jgi:hypothetical protein
MKNWPAGRHWDGGQDGRCERGVASCPAGPSLATQLHTTHAPVYKYKHRCRRCFSRGSQTRRTMLSGLPRHVWGTLQHPLPPRTPAHVRVGAGGGGVQEGASGAAALWRITPSWRTDHQLHSKRGRMGGDAVGGREARRIRGAGTRGQGRQHPTKHRGGAALHSASCRAAAVASSVARSGSGGAWPRHGSSGGPPEV